MYQKEVWCKWVDKLQHLNNWYGGYLTGIVP